MRGVNQFLNQKAIKAAFMAGAETIEIDRPDGTKITIRKENRAAPKGELIENEKPEDIVSLLK